jgi:class 3 adenylate cyclase
MPEEKPPSDPGSAGLERRLATILAADVAGYSRMMGEDEEATVRTLRGHREVFDALLKQHHGRVFNTAGDAILAEFPSAVEAVRCATEIQSALETRNEHLPPGQAMRFRMGINLGDVVVQGGDLLGDGVNVAARIQTVAEPGGICLSGSVYDQIRNKLSLQFNPMGDRSFKNIAQPIRTFTITHGESGVLPSAPPRSMGKRVPLVAAIAAGAVILVAGAWWTGRRTEKSAPIPQPAQPSPTAPPPPALAPGEPDQRAGKLARGGRFDGSYEGGLCIFPFNPDKKKCWQVPLDIKGGIATGVWPSRFPGKSSFVHATVSPDGNVAVTLDGWKDDATPLSGTLAGRLENGSIAVEGHWAGGAPLNGLWKRSHAS